MDSCPLDHSDEPIVASATYPMGAPVVVVTLMFNPDLDTETIMRRVQHCIDWHIKPDTRKLRLAAKAHEN